MIHMYLEVREKSGAEFIFLLVMNMLGERVLLFNLISDHVFSNKNILRETRLPHIFLFH